MCFVRVNGVYDKTGKIFVEKYIYIYKWKYIKALTLAVVEYLTKQTILSVVVSMPTVSYPLSFLN